MYLYILSWISTVIHVLFMTIALAAALYYLAEIVEEYTVLTAKIIKYLIIVVTGIYVGFIVFERFPWYMIALGLLANGIYALLLRDFPFIFLTSPIFIISCGLVFVNHYVAFQYFSTVWYPFSEILAYFTLCLWILPFTFFVSLSANENVLPTATSGSDGNDGDFSYPGSERKSRRHGILALFNYLSSKKEEYLPRNKTY